MFKVQWQNWKYHIYFIKFNNIFFFFVFVTGYKEIEIRTWGFHTCTENQLGYNVNSKFSDIIPYRANQIVTIKTYYFLKKEK